MRDGAASRATENRRRRRPFVAKWNPCCDGALLCTATRRRAQVGYAHTPSIFYGIKQELGAHIFTAARILRGTTEPPPLSGSRRRKPSAPPESGLNLEPIPIIRRRNARRDFWDGPLGRGSRRIGCAEDWESPDRPRQGRAAARDIRDHRALVEYGRWKVEKLRAICTGKYGSPFTYIRNPRGWLRVSGFFIV